MISFVASLLVIIGFAVAFGGWERTPSYFRSLMLIQMILVSLFAPKLFELGTFSSNVGSVLYAGVFVCQVVTLRRFGYRAAIENTWSVIGMMVFFYALLGIIGVMPITSEDANFAQAVDQIALTSPINSFISLIAFAGAQVILISILQRWRQWYATPIAIVVAQAVDSVVFYPVVFRGLSLHDMTQVTIDGYITKVACAALLIPAYLYASRKRPHDYVLRVKRAGGVETNADNGNELQ